MTGMEQWLKAMGVDPDGLKKFAEEIKKGLDRMDARLGRIETFMVRIDTTLLEMSADLGSDVQPAGGSYQELAAAGLPPEGRSDERQGQQTGR
jgi:hypothetical protein